MTWTDERISELIRLRHAGLSGRQIGQRMGVTRNAAIGKLNRLGILGTKPVASRDQPPRNRPSQRNPLARCTDYKAATFEPWEIRRKVRAIERERGLPFRALEYRHAVR